MQLLLLYPAVAYRSCEDCQLHLYNEQTGRRLEDRDGRPKPRPKGTHPPCRAKLGACPKGTPENPKSLSEKNVAAFRHYLECKAVGDFPNDAVVRRNAGIIRFTEDGCSELQAQRLAVMTRIGNGW